MSWQNPEKRRGRFVNPHVQNLKRTIWDAILWRFGFYDEPEPRVPPPDSFAYPAEAPPFDRSRPSAVWVGHSTYLIRAGDHAFLTDPIFSGHCAPLPIPAFKRLRSPSLSIEELPPIDFILLSHNHYDHLDEQSVRALHCRYPHLVWVVPQGLKKWLLKRGIESVVELGWGESSQLKEGCRVTAVPAQHFSGRSLWDKNRTLWCGYVVECGEKTFYFVGDTGYNSIHFKEIGKRWPKIDLSLIPIGTYAPQEFMKPVHISPNEAAEIHRDVHSRLSLGMHWNTFHLSDEPMDLPPYDLFLAMQERGLPFDTFFPIEPGVHVNW